MRLITFSTGTIRPQTIDGEEVLTAYVKRPVAEPWIITPTGPAGDEVAVHSDHLYVFDRDSYDFWAAELGVPREEWSDGLFAENLTVDTLDQRVLHVGDRFRLGTAVVVVTGPRVPCWKLTWALGQPKSFMRRFRLSGRSGAYFGVIRPGVVRPGDELTPLSSDPSAPSIETLSRLCDSSTQISSDELATIEKAFASEHLSRTARGTLTLKLAAYERDSGSSAGAWRGWRPFILAQRVTETADVSSFVLEPADAGALPGFRAGQHVVVRLSVPGRRPVTRTWSLSEFSAEPSRYRITVRLRPEGLGSRALSGPTAPAIELRTPAGHFHLDRGTFRPVVLIAAGIGITPMIAMLQAHLERGPAAPPLWVLYGSTAPEHAAFHELLGTLGRTNEDVHVQFFFTRAGTATLDDDAAVAGGAPAVRSGRLSADRVIETMRRNYLRTPAGPVLIPWFESDMYLCGPVEFTETVRDGLVRAGANPDLVRVEDFAAAAVEPSGPRRQTDAVVEFAGRKLETTWLAQSEQTILELAEDSDLELPFDCRAGTCRTCECALVSGSVDGPTSRGADGTQRVLICVSYPGSDRVVIEPPA